MPFLESLLCFSCTFCQLPNVCLKVLEGTLTPLINRKIYGMDDLGTSYYNSYSDFVTESVKNSVFNSRLLEGSNY